MGVSFLEAMDTDELRRDAKLRGLSHEKRVWIKKGYSEQMSFYGAVENTATDSTRRQRIEILSPVSYTQHIIRIIYNFFCVYHPAHRYSLWAFTRENESLQMIGGRE